MRRNVGMASGVLLLGLAACAGPSSSRAVEEPASRNSLPAGQEGAEPVASEEHVRSADLPGEPGGAVGFTFGAAPKDAEAACTRSGHAWKKLDDRTFHCDGIPNGPDMHGTVFLQTCGVEVCLLRVTLNPEDTSESGWLALYESVLASLEHRHGEPWQKQQKLPVRCRGKDLNDCLEKGEAALDATWHWPGGEKVELRMVPPTKARSIALRLTYSAAGQP